MLTLCWAAKGGSGTTVVAATLALASPHPTVLVDLAGDLPLALGLADPAGPGVGEWSAGDSPAGRLPRLHVPLAPGVELLPMGSTRPRGRWGELAEHLARIDATVVVDAGTGPPPIELRRCADRTWLVTRPCYLALRRAVDTRCPVDGVVLVDEPGRALTAQDVAAAIGAPVVRTLLLDPAVARAVDSGLLLARLPRGYRQVLGGTS